jgi:hypothetical protein
MPRSKPSAPKSTVRLLQESLTWIFGYCRWNSTTAGNTCRTANAGIAVIFTTPAGSD